MARKRCIFRVARVDEHNDIVQIAKLTKWTKTFGHIWFSPPQAYERRWIWVATDTAGKIIGFACVRPLKRRPEVVLHFVGVAPEAQRKGVAWRLLNALMAHRMVKRMVLKVAKDNPAKGFYDKQGFKVESEDDKYWTMARSL